MIEGFNTFWRNIRSHKKPYHKIHKTLKNNV